MKRYGWMTGMAALCCAGLFVEPAQAAATGGTVALSFTTSTVKGKFAPRHYLAVWVADAQGKLVRTLRANAKAKRVPTCLRTWAAAGGGPDAVTGATLASYAAPNNPVAVTWDCRDAKGTVVPDGDYVLMAEYTEANAQGPVTPAGRLRVTKGPAASEPKIADLPGFTGISLKFTPAGP